MRCVVTHKKVKAGKKKIMPKSTLEYLPPLKRPLLLFSYMDKLVRLSRYTDYKLRISHSLYDLLLNYKQSQYYNLKVNTYKKFIKKSFEN